MVELPRVSVIIAAYNAERYLPATLRSALAQSLQDLEVIVVDDGSTDRTAAIAEAIGDPRVRVLRQANAGPAAARNLGLAAARGEFVAILDADDLWRPNKLERQVALLEAQPALGLCFTHVAVVDQHGMPLRGTEEERLFNVALRDRAQTLQELLAVRNRLAHSSALIRREALERVGGYDEQYFAVEDFDLWLRLLADWEVTLVTEPLTVYRANRGGLTSTVLQSYRMLQVALIVQRAVARLPLEAIFPWLRAPGSSGDADAAARARAHTALAGLLLESGFAELVPTALDQLHQARALAPEMVSREALRRLGLMRRRALVLNSLDAFPLPLAPLRALARLQAAAKRRRRGRRGPPNPLEALGL